MTNKFQYTNEANPHVERARQMIKDHPKFKELMHHYPFTAVIEAFRPGRLKKIKLFERWVLLNILTVLAANTAISMLVGSNALFYLLFSSVFALALHPCGVRCTQSTSSLIKTSIFIQGPLSTMKRK